MSEVAALPDRQYPVDTLALLLTSPLVTPATEAALTARREAAAVASILAPEVVVILTAVAARLIPQPGPRAPVNLASEFGRRLAEEAGDGWRYAELPVDAVLFDRGLRALDTAATTMFGIGFFSLAPDAQDELLREVQFNRVTGAEWRGIRADRFFEELLVMLVDIYYSHPSAQEEIGYAGMADARGWQKVGLGERVSYEPEPVVGASR